MSPRTSSLAGPREAWSSAGLTEAWSPDGGRGSGVDITTENHFALDGSRPRRFRVDRVRPLRGRRGILASQRSLAVVLRARLPEHHGSGSGHGRGDRRDRPPISSNTERRRDSSRRSPDAGSPQCVKARNDVWSTCLTTITAPDVDDRPSLRCVNPTTPAKQRPDTPAVAESTTEASRSSEQVGG